MTASEWIERLTRLQAEHGDLEVEDLEGNIVELPVYNDDEGKCFLVEPR